MKRILVTGGCAFIGANFIQWSLRQYEDLEIVNLDSLTYAGNLETLAALAEDPRYIFQKGDIGDKDAVLQAAQGADAIVNFAAESFVDRNIKDPGVFIQTNCLGTGVLLAVAQKTLNDWIIYICPSLAAAWIDPQDFPRVQSVRCQ